MRTFGSFETAVGAGDMRVDLGTTGRGGRGLGGGGAGRGGKASGASFGDDNQYLVVLEQLLALVRWGEGGGIREGNAVRGVDFEVGEGRGGKGVGLKRIRDIWQV